MIDTLTFSVIDFQIANPSPTSACLIVILRVEEGQIVDTFKSYLKPSPFFFNNINGHEYPIEETMCIAAPSFGSIFDKIRSWLENQIIVSHQIVFVKNILHNLLETNKIDITISDYLSSQEVARVGLPKLNNSNISTVYKHLFGVDFKHKDAIEVANANAKIICRIVNEWGPPNFERMISALYGEQASFRINRFGKVRFRSLYTDPNYRFVEKTELQGTGFTFLGDIKGLSKEDASNFILTYGGKVKEKINNTTTHLIVENMEGENHKQNSYNIELMKAIEMARKDSEISILSTARFLQLIKIVKEQEEKSRLSSTFFPAI